MKCTVKKIVKFILIILLFSAHGCHLSVQDFLYKNTFIAGTDVPVPGEDDLVPVHSRDETDDDDKEEEEEQTEEEQWQAQEEVEDVEEALQSFVVEFDVMDEVVPDLKEDFKKLLNKVRKVVKYFKNFPSGRDVLQEVYDAVRRRATRSWSLCLSA